MPVPRPIQWLYVVLALGALVVFAGWRSDLAKREALWAGAAKLGAQVDDRVAHDFELRTLDGGRVRLSDLAGRVVFLNFWASWCPPCIEELPALEKLATSLEGRPIVMLAVSQDETWADLIELFGSRRPSMTVAFDPSGGLAHLYGTEKLPETYVIGRDGRVVARFVNVQQWDSQPMSEWFGRLLVSGI